MSQEYRVAYDGVFISLTRESTLMKRDLKSEYGVAGDSETFQEMEGSFCPRFMWFRSGFLRGNSQR